MLGSGIEYAYGMTGHGASSMTASAKWDLGISR